MGEPAMPTAQERAETWALAAKIVEAVRNDEGIPLPLLEVQRMPAPMFHRAAVESLVLQFAQEIELLRDEVARLDHLVDILEHRDAERERAGQ